MPSIEVNEIEDREGEGEGEGEGGREEGSFWEGLVVMAILILPPVPALSLLLPLDGAPGSQNGK